MITGCFDEYGIGETQPRSVLDLIEGKAKLDAPEDEVRTVATTLLANGYDDNDTYSVLVDPDCAVFRRYAEHHPDADDEIMYIVLAVSETIDPRGIDAISPTAEDLHFDLDRHEELVGFSAAITDGRCSVYQASESVFLVRHDEAEENESGIVPDSLEVTAV